MPDRLDDIAHLLQAEDFFEPANQVLFRHMRQVRAEDGRIDVTLLCSRLKKHGECDQAGGAAHLARITGSVPTAAHAVYYAKQVLEFSKLRQFIDRGTTIVCDAYERATDTHHQLGLAEQRILEVRDQRQPIKLQLVQHSMSEALASSNGDWPGHFKPCGRSLAEAWGACTDRNPFPHRSSFERVLRIKEQSRKPLTLVGWSFRLGRYPESLPYNKSAL